MTKRYLIYIVISAMLAVFLISVGMRSSYTRCFSNGINDDISWADSVFLTLSLEEKIAQLISIRAHSDKTEAYCADLVSQVRKYKVGGACFFQGGPARQAMLTNRMQAASTVPMMISIDGEWGLAMRLDSVPLYPRHMALGASNDLSGIYLLGESIANQCKRLGVHVNFAPCVDVNTRANNPVIGSRSFGSHPGLVAQCGASFVDGLQKNQVMACAKHFPGHGDTETDSHFDLPVINKNLEELEKNELFPFKYLIHKGVDAVMVSHLNVPALDSTKGSIATTSYAIVTELLKNKMQFNGLIFTDGLEMKGITSYYRTGEMEVAALAAGCDVLLLPGGLDTVIPAIVEAVQQGILTEKDIDEKCLKVLKMKEKYVLPNCKPIVISRIASDLNNSQAKQIYRRMTEHSITILQNHNNILPLKKENKQNIIHLRVDKLQSKHLHNALNEHLKIPTIYDKSLLTSNTAAILDSLKQADCVIVSLHSISQYPKNNYGMTKKIIQFLDTLTQMKPVILVVMGNPYCLEYLPFTERFASIVLGYHPVMNAEHAIGHILTGALPSQGQLPINLTAYPVWTGIHLDTASAHSKDTNAQLITPSGTTRETTHPILNKIDSLVMNGLNKKAFPGCRVLVYHNGNTVYDRSFGTLSYPNTIYKGINSTFDGSIVPSENEQNESVNENTMYDIASLTKIFATTLAVMKLYDEGKISVKDKLSNYLIYLQGTNKESITIAQAMTHTAGLQSWIPFYQRTLLPDGGLNPVYYRTTQSDDFSIPVNTGLYLRTDYVDTIRSLIVQSKVKPGNGYVYSDLGFYLLADLVESVTGKSLDCYVNEVFYEPMFLQRTTFNPWTGFPLDEIPPTEHDKVFRHALVRGYVHDQGAAMLGGVSGHAGLFASAYDLLALGKLLMDGGIYKDEIYLSKKTIDYFTAYYYSSGNCRRGLGFDKPSRTEGSSPCSRAVSSKSYGHSGFTGTFYWSDPKENLIYIFLSNRTFPDSENIKLTQLGIRISIQDVIYQYIESNRA